MISAVVPYTREQQVARAHKLAGPWEPTIWYFLDAELGTRNGGRDPKADDCATHWKDENGKPWATADCVGFASWVKGFPRKMKAFPLYGGYVNTDSMILDAEGPRSLLRPVSTPSPGTLIVMPSLFDEHGHRLSPGHVGVVVDSSLWYPAAPHPLQLIHVAHCSPRNHRRFHQAIGITSAELWGSRRWRLLDLVA